jgi:hypothetical protein
LPINEEVQQYVTLAITKGPKVALKLGWRFLKVKKKAQRAEAIFRRRLVASGLDPETAQRLTDRYGSTVSVRSILQTIRFRGRALDNGNE